jgi:hypothetical protein
VRRPRSHEGDRAIHREDCWLCGRPAALRFARPERRLLAGRQAFLGHGEQHRDHDVGAGHRGEIDHLLLALQRFGAGEGLVGNGMLGRQFGDEVVDRGFVRRHAGRTLVFALSSATTCGDNPALIAKGS